MTHRVILVENIEKEVFSKLQGKDPSERNIPHMYLARPYSRTMDFSKYFL